MLAFSSAIVYAIVAVAIGVTRSPNSGLETRSMSRAIDGAADVNADADADIRALIAEQAAAWNRHDATAWASRFVPEAEFINILGTSFSGKAAIEGVTTRIFATIFKESHDSVTVQKIMWVSPDLAIAHYEHAVSGYTALPPGIQPSEIGVDGKGVLRTRMVYMLKRALDGKWMIVNGQNTAILPAFKAP
jgi:uncharacterized protein (TIGR02246 family)